MRHSKLLILISATILMQQAIAMPPLETDGLTRAEKHLLKQYAAQPTFAQYYSREGDYPDDSSKIEVAYTGDLNNDRLTKKFASRTYLMRQCAASMINYKLGKEYLVVGGECYTYAFTEAAGFFNPYVLTEHRQVFNFHTITDNAYTCAELGSCSRSSSQTFNPADLSNVYAIFTSYFNKCTSDSCRTDIALIAYYAPLYAAPVSYL